MISIRPICWNTTTECFTWILSRCEIWTLVDYNTMWNLLSWFCEMFFYEWNGTQQSIARFDWDIVSGYWIFTRTYKKFFLELSFSLQLLDCVNFFAFPRIRSFTWEKRREGERKKLRWNSSSSECAVDTSFNFTYGTCSDAGSSFLSLFLLLSLDNNSSTHILLFVFTLCWT